MSDHDPTVWSQKSLKCVDDDRHRNRFTSRPPTLLLKEYDALAAFIHASERRPDLIVVVVYDRRPLNEQPAFGARPKNCQLHGALRSFSRAASPAPSVGGSPLAS